MGGAIVSNSTLGKSLLCSLKVYHGVDDDFARDASTVSHLFDKKQ